MVCGALAHRVNLDHGPRVVAHTQKSRAGSVGVYLERSVTPRGERREKLARPPEQWILMPFAILLDRPLKLHGLSPLQNIVLRYHRHLGTSLTGSAAAFYSGGPLRIAG